MLIVSSFSVVIRLVASEKLCFFASSSLQYRCTAAVLEREVKYFQSPTSSHGHGCSDSELKKLQSWLWLRTVSDTWGYH
jgi:hypothetical protein